MPRIPFTPQQQRAIETTGRSLVVTAAAGSGKTAVLAERCAYLVCDAPAPFRCDVDALLVLTFTDAAAAEMRTRVVDAIAARAHERPGERRLKEQMALSDAAQISTIHAFCLWVVRRWFNEADIDPSCTTLDEQEARLLKQEVLDGLFDGLYSELPKPNPALGRVTVLPGGDGGAATSDTPALPEAFRRLVDVYGLGSDQLIGSTVLSLYEFTTTRPDADDWLTDAAFDPESQGDAIILDLLSTLSEELQRQITHCERLAAGITCPHGGAVTARSKILDYIDSLRAWLADLPPSSGTADTVSSQLAVYERVCGSISDFTFSNKRGPRLPKDADPALKAEVKQAQENVKDVRSKLHGKRLKERYAIFSIADMRAGLRMVAPFVGTLTTLVRRFAEAYATRKRELNVLDFSDQEAFAYRLLRSDADPQAPSSIALELHRRFAHVLVDEFQDVNPMQDAILRLVSHEADPKRADNLFVVGDVKQSIYRFRLASPEIFTDRLRRFRQNGTEGEAIALQRNFRSRAHLLEAINEVFRLLMPRGAGAIEYDEEAELHPGRTEPIEAAEPVELHLLEANWSDPRPTSDENDDDDESTDVSTAADEPPTPISDDPEAWSAIEREGRLIGRRIQEWLDAGQRGTDGQPLRFGDVAVLVRAAKGNAERIAAMLSSMGIPAQADVGGSLFEAVEVRDVLAALELLDNAQQDLPLAAVMRSGVLGHRFTENDLLAIRLLDRHADFHGLVRRYRVEGERSDLRERVGVFLTDLDRLRVESRRRPPADLLGKLYGELGHVAYVSGMVRGRRRRANLLKFHELARKFGSFRTQGLHRFLRFIDAIKETDDNVSLASTASDAANAVQVLSIHKSKGLEFPVVFLAGLGGRFNQRDRIGRIIHQPDAKIGLRVVDTERMIEYPSCAHTRAVNEDERESLSEELRILYVGMTRARDRLILVGSCRHAEETSDRLRTGTEVDLSPFVRETPKSLLDWLLGAIGAVDAQARSQGIAAAAPDMARGLFRVHAHTRSAILTWRGAGETRATDDQATRRAVVAGADLPPAEPSNAQDETAQAVQSRLDFVYPYLSTTSVHATVAASEHRGVYDFADTPPAVKRDRAEPAAWAVPPSKYESAAITSAADRGTIMHRVLQHLDFGQAHDAGLDAALQGLIEGGILGETERDCVDVPGLAWFVGTPLGAAIRRSGAAYRREFQYVGAERPTDFDATIVPGDGDFVLVRGVVDGILPVDGGLEVIDFKTDAVAANELDARVERYRPQVALYRSAVSRIWKVPVVGTRLVFLTPRVIVDVT